MSVRQWLESPVWDRPPELWRRIFEAVAFEQHKQIAIVLRLRSMEGNADAGKAEQANRARRCDFGRINPCLSKRTPACIENSNGAHRFSLMDPVDSLTTAHLRKSNFPNRFPGDKAALLRQFQEAFLDGRWG
jgi:hypothetical protein